MGGDAEDPDGESSDGSKGTSINQFAWLPRAQNYRVKFPSIDFMMRIAGSLVIMRKCIRLRTQENEVEEAP